MIYHSHTRKINQYFKRVCEPTVHTLRELAQHQIIQYRNSGRNVRPASL